MKMTSPPDHRFKVSKRSNLLTTTKVLALSCFLALSACANETRKTSLAPQPAPPVQTAQATTVQIVKPQCEYPIFNIATAYAIEAWGVPGTRFAVGAPLLVQSRVHSPSYLSIYHVSSSCKVSRLLNNVQVATGQIVDFPLKGSGLDLIVKPPAGQEAFYFVATHQPFEFLSASDILSESGHIASIDLSPDQFYARLESARGRINPATLSMTTLHTEIIQH